MKALIQTTRSISRAIVLVLAVAAVAVPAAQANHQYGDAFDRALGTAVGPNVAQYPDAAERAAQNGQALVYPDAFERAVGSGQTQVYADAFERAVGSGQTQLGSLDQIELVRSQPRADVPMRGLDKIEALRLEPRQVTTPSFVSSPGIDWPDAGIGAGIALGAMLLAAAAALALRGRGRVAHS